MTTKKKNVISVRLDDSTYKKLEEMKVLLEGIDGTFSSHGDLFKRMISLYHRYLLSLDEHKQDYHQLQNEALIKALTEDKPEPETPETPKKA
jgi:hypothetical protein